MAVLARQVLRGYRDPTAATDLDNRFRLQLVSGDFAGAIKSLDRLHALASRSSSPQDAADNIQYRIYAEAMMDHIKTGAPLAETFVAAFEKTFNTLDDRTSALVVRAFGADRPSIRQDLDDALARQKGKAAVSPIDALALVHAFQVERAFEVFAPFTNRLIAWDDARRYVVDRDVRVRTPGDATVCALIVRQRAAVGRRLPILLNFTIYADPVTLMSEARRTASNGYVGVEGLTRGKGCSPDRPIPYEHDGADAAALIDWIAALPWSDGRVRMYGGSYEGFAQWAAAKHRPKALKALMPSVTAAPGIDVPMEGGIFYNFVYYWPLYAAANKTLDNGPYEDHARWERMRRQWYISGRAWRTLEGIDGTANPIFDRWLRHPTYDAYWRAMIPQGDEFSGLDIPVLTTTGYYDDAQIGALHYFIEHHKYVAGAEHYLLIGPYDHVLGQRGVVTTLGNVRDVVHGYRMDPVARIDLGEMRYQWFDYVFKGAPRPALLADRVNYEVMGANTWRHAPTLAAMANTILRLHLVGGRPGMAGRLLEQPSSDPVAVTQTVDLADRSDVDRVSPAGGGVIDKALDTHNGLAFISDPWPQSADLSGLFSAHLEIATNKRDFDFEVTLYELTTEGDYVQLSYFIGRASQVTNLTRRTLLAPGRRELLDFTAGRLTSRRIQRGSRLVVLLSVVKQPEMQINYGTGKDVSDETIADAGDPLTLRWLPASYVDVPVWR